MRALRVTRGAWGLVLDLVTDRLRADGVPVPPVEPAPTSEAAPEDDSRDDDARDELRGLGILGADGELDRAWAAAVGNHLVAPVRAALSATAGDQAGTTRFSLVDDRVLLTQEGARGTAGPAGLDVAEVSAHVEVVLARVDDLWPALTRYLPPLPQLTAPARPARRASDTPVTVLDHGQTERMRAGTGLDDLPPAARAVAEGEEAAVVVVVEAWPTPAAPTVVWTRWWSVASGQLLDVQVDDDGARLVEREPGALAAELRWALAGAVDATSGEAPEPAGDAR